MKTRKRRCVIIIETGLVLAGVSLAKLYDVVAPRIFYTEEERARISTGKKQADKMREARRKQERANKKRERTRKQNAKANGEKKDAKANTRKKRRKKAA
jgi:hypothetical protein